MHLYKFIRLLALPLLLATDGNPLPAQSAKLTPPEEGFDFKGARLGMTLAEWKTLRPDLNSLLLNVGATKKSQPIKIWCSDARVPISKTESMPASPLTRAEQNAGVLTCRYGRLDQISSIVLVAPSYLNVGDGYTNKIVYKFLDGRLYAISIEGNVDLYKGVLEGLIAKFGTPTADENDSVTNGFGSNFPRTKKYWMRGNSAIHLEAPFEKLDQMKVTYFVPSAMQRILEAQPKGPPAHTKM